MVPQAIPALHHILATAHLPTMGTIHLQVLPIRIQDTLAAPAITMHPPADTNLQDIMALLIMGPVHLATMEHLRPMATTVGLPAILLTPLVLAITVHPPALVTIALPRAIHRITVAHPVMATADLLALATIVLLPAIHRITVVRPVMATAGLLALATIALPRAIPHITVARPAMATVDLQLLATIVPHPLAALAITALLQAILLTTVLQPALDTTVDLPVILHTLALLQAMDTAHLQLLATLRLLAMTEPQIMTATARSLMVLRNIRRNSIPSLLRSLKKTELQ